MNNRIAIIAGVILSISISNFDIGKASAFRERPKGDGTNRLADGKVFHAAAFRKCSYTDGPDGVGKGDSSQTFATIERIVVD